VFVEPLTHSDVGGALALSRQAGWGLTRLDWASFVAAERVRSLGGWIDGALVATTTVAQYGDLAWIGCVLVAETRRREGLGTEIFRAACDRADARVLGLDANPSGRPLYRHSGFRTVGTVQEYVGTPTPASARRVSGATLTDLGDITRYDRSRTGLDRWGPLTVLGTDPETRVFVHRAPDVDGYAVRHRDGDGVTLGPVVADSPAVAAALVREAAERGTQLTVRTPRPPVADPVDWRGLGLEPSRSLDRMVAPPVETPLAGDAVRAIATYALG
jgi:GNAT superfamily N-acetyltransferase